MNTCLSRDLNRSKQRIAILSYKTDLISKKIYRILKRKYTVLYATENPEHTDELDIRFDNPISVCGFLDYNLVNSVVICSSLFDDDNAAFIFDRVKNILSFCTERGIKPVFIFEKYRVVDYDNSLKLIGKDDAYYDYCNAVQDIVLKSNNGLVIICPTVFGYDVSVPSENLIEVFNKTKALLIESFGNGGLLLADKVAEHLSNSIEQTGEISLLDATGLSDVKDLTSLEDDERALLRQSGCVFNLIYQLMPSDYFGGERVAEIRVLLGQKLSSCIPDDIKQSVDYIVPVPKTGLFYAMGLSQALNIPYMQGLLKENTSDRSFQLIDINARKKFLKSKISAIDELLKGKSIILVDEAIFTGTTLKMVCNMLWELGVKRVYIAIPTPQCYVSCDYYVQPKRDMLLQYIREDMLNEYFGVDGVYFQTIDSFTSSIPTVNGLCTECFTRR